MSLPPIHAPHTKVLESHDSKTGFILTEGEVVTLTAIDYSRGIGRARKSNGSEDWIPLKIVDIRISNTYVSASPNQSAFGSAIYPLVETIQGYIRDVRVLQRLVSRGELYRAFYMSTQIASQHKDSFTPYKNTFDGRLHECHYVHYREGAPFIHEANNFESLHLPHIWVFRCAIYQTQLAFTRILNDITPPVHPFVRMLLSIPEDNKVSFLTVYAFNPASVMAASTFQSLKAVEAESLVSASNYTQETLKLQGDYTYALDTLELMINNLYFEDGSGTINVQDIKRLGPLGKGGSGSVFKGLWLDSTPVALKELSRGQERDRDFYREAFSLRSASNPGHPHVMRFYGITRSGPVNYLVTEYIHGHSLENMIESGQYQILSPNDRMQIASQFISGLDYLHQYARLVHCDLAPRNIIAEVRVFNGSYMVLVKIGDLGSCRVMDSERRARYSIIGSDPRRWAPECHQEYLIESQHSPSEPLSITFSDRSDIYAAAIVILELFNLSTESRGLFYTSRIMTPFPRPALLRLIEKIDEPFDILKSTLQRCLDESPVARPTSLELLKLLSEQIRVISMEEESMSSSPYSSSSDFSLGYESSGYTPCFVTGSSSLTPDIAFPKI